jgi:hypothetical protein
LPVFLIFSKKIKKTGNQTLFYFAAGGGEILVIHPLLHNPLLSRSPLTQKRIFAKIVTT